MLKKSVSPIKAVMITHFVARTEFYQPVLRDSFYDQFDLESPDNTHKWLNMTFNWRALCLNFEFDYGDYDTYSVYVACRQAIETNRTINRKDEV